MVLPLVYWWGGAPPGVLVGVLLLVYWWGCSSWCAGGGAPPGVLVGVVLPLVCWWGGAPPGGWWWCSSWWLVGVLLLVCWWGRPHIASRSQAGGQAGVVSGRRRSRG